ncbi:putative aTP-binding protein FecE, partial [Vibrio parahaemolyticus V-223/04]
TTAINAWRVRCLYCRRFWSVLKVLQSENWSNMADRLISLTGGG